MIVEYNMYCWQTKCGRPIPLFDLPYDECLQHLRQCFSGHNETVLDQLISHGLSAQDSINKKTFVRELAAFLDFKATGRCDGSCPRTIAAMKQHPLLAEYMFHRCVEIKNTKDWTSGQQWFHLRIAVMDVCCAASIINDSSQFCIFYGGRIHAQNLLRILQPCEECWATELMEMAQKHELPLFTTIRWKTKTVVVLGEIHPKTPMDFARELVTFCQQQCAKEEKISIFLEKHPSNGDDALQQDLTCNLKDKLALQSVRCAFPLNCHAVRSYDVDFRHVELGFLRYELLCLDEEDETFAEWSQNFQNSALSDMMTLALLSFS